MLSRNVLTPYLCCVTFQKSEDLIYVTAVPEIIQQTCTYVQYSPLGKLVIPYVVSFSPIWNSHISLRCSEEPGVDHCPGPHLLILCYHIVFVHYHFPVHVFVYPCSNHSTLPTSISLYHCVYMPLPDLLVMLDLITSVLYGEYYQL
jgi:hypothetical protein